MRKKILTTGLLSIVLGCANITPPNSKIAQPTNSLSQARYSVNDDELTEHSLTEIINSTYKVFNEVTYRARDGEQTILRGHGSCIAYRQLNVFGKDPKTVYLTASHVTKMYPPVIITGVAGKRRPFFYESGTAHIMDDSGKKRNLTVIADDPKNDIQILESEKAIVNCFKRLAPPNTVKQGDIVYGVGFPYDRGKTLTKGIVSDLSDPTRIFIDSHTNPGNSGGPHAVFHNGKPYLLGLSSIKYVGGEGISGITRPKHLHKLLREVKLL